VGVRRHARLWDLENGELINGFGGHDRAGGPSPIGAVALSRHGDLLALGDDYGGLFDVSSGKELRTFGREIAVSGEQLLTGSVDARLFQLPSLQLIAELKGHRRFEGAATVRAVALAAQAARAATAARNEKVVRIWDTTNATVVAKREGVLASALAISPDGKLVLTGGMHGEMAVIDGATGSKNKSAFHHRGDVNALAFSPDGRTALSGSDDGTACLMRLPQLDCDQRLEGHASRVTAVAFGHDGRFALTGSGDGAVRLWDARTGKLRATLSSFRSGDWLVSTPDGSFDGSPDAYRRQVLRFGDDLRDVSPIEIGFRQFFRPGLLGRVLADAHVPPRASIASLDRRQPSVLLAVDGQAGKSRTVDVRIRVREAPSDRRHPRGSGVRDVRLFRNGSLVKIWRGDVRLDASGSAELTAKQIAIEAGANELTAYAFSATDLKSTDAILSVTGAAELARPRHVHVLAIGIDKYADSGVDLRYAGADATSFAAQIAEEQRRIDANAVVHTAILRDGRATRANLTAALTRLAGSGTADVAEIAELQPARPEDSVFVYFAGHGVAASGRFYLIPHEAVAAGQPKLEAAISDEDLTRLFEPITARHFLLVLDACQSGQALESAEDRFGPLNSRGLAQLAHEKGMHVIAAAQAYQAAVEARELGHGFLTHALIEEGLKKRASLDAIEVRSWLRAGARRVPELELVLLQDAQRQGRALVLVQGDDATKAPTERVLQRPRIFFRRERDVPQFVIAAKPATSTAIDVNEPNGDR
jgi:hypothetical protein